MPSLKEEFSIRYRQDGTYWYARGREREITFEQTVRLLNLIWTKQWQVESITVFERATDTEQKIHP